MRPEWYGDKRDLVKWGILLRLAHLHRAGRILYVAYYRPSRWPRIKIDGERSEIPKAVTEHFRNLRNIRNLTGQPRIDVMMSCFSDREKYTREILRKVGASESDRRIVFLDPDTGLAPRKPNRKHVREPELESIWKAMRRGDLLVFYQHRTNRKGTPWINRKRKQFERALGLAPGAAKIALEERRAPEVALFYCRKASPGSRQVPSDEALQRSGKNRLPLSA